MVGSGAIENADCKSRIGNASDIIIIPLGGWHIALPTAIKGAPLGAVIVVNTEEKAELGRITAGKDRLNRPDLIFEVREGAGA
jgi:hypothetical protein